MKKQEIETIIQKLKEVKEITDKQEYLVSSAINQKLTEVFPLLDKELQRLDNNKIEVTSPAIVLVNYDPESNPDKSFTEYFNSVLHNLVLQDFKIIDYGIYPGLITGYIKYTT